MNTHRPFGNILSLAFVALAIFFGNLFFVHFASAAEFSIKKDGSGNFTTIQSCLDQAEPGSICRVGPGVYEERVKTKKNGASGAPITLLGEQGAVLHGIDIVNNYITVKNLEFTNVPPYGFNGVIQVLQGVNDIIIEKNHVHDIAGRGMSGIRFIESQRNLSAQAQNVLIKDNRFERINWHLISMDGIGTVIEGNYFATPCGDAIRVFGKNITIRNNYFTKIDSKDGCGHVDVFQTFGLNGNATAQDVLIENNFIENITGQIAQLESDGSPNIHSFTFRGNVFARTFGPIQALVPKVRIENNTFYYSSQSAGHSISVATDPDNGPAALNGVVVNNAFVAGGLDPDTRTNRGWYGVGSSERNNPANTTLRASFVGQSNFVAGSPPAFKKKDTNCSLPYPAFDFCEATREGLNGGDPQFSNPSNPLGPDGLPLTLDDGLKPRASSLLCGKGENGGDIGAYSCRSGVVSSHGGTPVVFTPRQPIPPVIPVPDPIPPVTPTTAPTTPPATPPATPPSTPPSTPPLTPHTPDNPQAPQNPPPTVPVVVNVPSTPPSGGAQPPAQSYPQTVHPSTTGITYTAPRGRPLAEKSAPPLPESDRTPFEFSPPKTFGEISRIIIGDYIDQASSLFNRLLELFIK